MKIFEKLALGPVDRTGVGEGVGECLLVIGPPAVPPIHVGRDGAKEVVKV